MSGPDSAPVPAKRAWGLPRVEALLLFGYVLVVVAATFTVVIPELSKEPEQGPAQTSGQSSGKEAAHTSTK